MTIRYGWSDESVLCKDVNRFTGWLSKQSILHVWYYICVLDKCQNEYSRLYGYIWKLRLNSLLWRTKPICSMGEPHQCLRNHRRSGNAYIRSAHITVFFQICVEMNDDSNVWQLSMKRHTDAMMWEMFSRFDNWSWLASRVFLRKLFPKIIENSILAGGRIYLAFNWNEPNRNTGGDCFPEKSCNWYPEIFAKHCESIVNVWL